MNRTGNLVFKILISFVFCFIIKASIAQDKRIKISSCESNEALADVFLISPGNTLLAVTDDNGIALISDTTSLNNIRISKLGFRDTIITVTHTQPITICLRVKNHSLPQLEVSSKQFSLHEQLEAYIETTSKHLLKETDTLYYKYEYNLNIPDSNWVGSMMGILILPLRDYDKLYGGFAQIQYCSTFEVDSAMWNSTVINILSTSHLSWFFNSDNLRKGHVLRKGVKKRWTITKNYSSSSYIEFEIYGYDKNFSNAKIKIRFNEDSLASSFESQWKSHADKNIRAGKNNSLISHHYLYTYRKELPLFFNFIYGKLGFRTSAGMHYNIEFKMNLLPEPEIIKNEFCFDHSTWIELNPEYFRKNNLVTTFY